MTRPRILIADDHRILADGLRGLLEPEFEVIALVTDGRALVSAAQEMHPDVIIADVSMPSLSGIEAAAHLRTQGIKAPVVFLTMHQEVAYARRAMEAGAAGYVLKHAAAAELVTAVRAALRRQTYVTPMIAGDLLQSYRTNAAQPHDPGAELTLRQREVLQLVAEGRSAKEVAGVLKISVRTAEFHKARILDTLGLQTTAELVQYAIRHGIVAV